MLNLGPQGEHMKVIEMKRLSLRAVTIERQLDRKVRSKLYPINDVTTEMQIEIKREIPE